MPNSIEAKPFEPLRRPPVTIEEKIQTVVHVLSKLDGLKREGVVDPYMDEIEYFVAAELSGIPSTNVSLEADDFVKQGQYAEHIKRMGAVSCTIEGLQRGLTAIDGSKDKRWFLRVFEKSSETSWLVPVVGATLHFPQEK